MKRNIDIDACLFSFIVINELDGLAKGSKEGQYDSADQANKVRERSKQTVEFLEEEFEKKNSHLKALTSKGNVLETISFRSEEGDSSGVREPEGAPVNHLCLRLYTSVFLFYILREIMMISFYPVVFTTARTKLVNSCPKTKVNSSIQ